ncbi:hypothetical protein Tco_0080513, partial [Tanacetum coccineum]
MNSTSLCSEMENFHDWHAPEFKATNRANISSEQVLPSMISLKMGFLLLLSK